MTRMLVNNTLIARFKKIRPLLLILVALTVLFYYSFMNEEYSLNQHLDETALPRITKINHNKGGQDTTEQELSKEELEEFELSTPHGIKEKNKYFALVQSEAEHSRIEFTLPDKYFEDQFSMKLRPSKKKFRYSVGHENYHKFPKIKKKDEYPSIQSSYFSDGGLKIEDKLTRIRQAFIDSWKSYKDFGYGHDEVLPISHRASDPFNGWSASIVDALDTMKLLGLDDEFSHAVNYLKKINFKQSVRDDIPLFENTIRILAGLISGYEVSQDKSLLKHAKEFADLLIEAFDTPNHMPLLYYKWRDELQNRFASKTACLAEVGSLSLEFSRLTQLTGDNKYYDAITRITKLFEKSFDNFFLPGLYSNRVDISGCKIINAQQAEGVSNSKILKVIKDEKFEHCLMHEKLKASEKVERYSLGGLGDSFYEYLPKMFHLLRGHDQDAKTYKEMYLRAMDQVREYMLFRPRIPNSENLLFISSVQAQKTEFDITINQDLDMSHLTCFAGGMFALGSRLFNISQDMELAEKVTMGCVEMYERFHIMPESLKVDKMLNSKDLYNETYRLELISKANISPFGIKTEDARSAARETLLRQMEKAEQEDAKEYNTKSTTKNEDGGSGEVKNAKKVFKRDEAVSVTKINTEVDKLPIQLKFKNVDALPPFKILDDGSKVWSVNKAYNQPIWVNAMNPKYILRPEAIESVYYMYRITGDSKWRDYGWKMWENVEKFCKTSENQFASLIDVTNIGSDRNFADSLESFWFAETLKYYYLLFEDINVWSLDDYVFNTEAHPFKLVN